MTGDDLKKDDKALREAVERRARQSFKFFFRYVWKESIELIEGEQFRWGQHIEEWCDYFQFKSYSSLKAPRKHLKSTIARAFIGWLLFRLPHLPGLLNEYWYYSYTGTLAGEHTERIKKYIKVNRFFRGFKSISPAKTILEYQYGPKLFVCKPEGILSATRGRHPAGAICDDILRDPSNKLDIAIIQKITRYFLEEIVSLPKENGFLKLVGTPQDKRDLFERLKSLKKFTSKEYKAITNEKKKTTLWPEMFSYERLMDIRDNEIGPKAFEKEYQCMPVRSADQYLNEEKLMALVNPDLKNWTVKEARKKYEKAMKDEKAHPFGRTVGGFDIGKKVHPSHLAIFEKDTGKQVQSKWMDGWDYERQIDYLTECIEVFNIEKLCYDNTRGEFELAEEQGRLHAAFTPVVLTGKKQYEMATVLDKAVNRGTIELINDDRQISQMLNMDNDLKSMQTAEGHGDSFWSICLAQYANEETWPEVI